MIPPPAPANPLIKASDMISTFPKQKNYVYKFANSNAQGGRDPELPPVRIRIEKSFRRTERIAEAYEDVVNGVCRRRASSPFPK